MAVRCIRDDFGPTDPPFVHKPVAGRDYTIREWHLAENGIGLYLEEVVNPELMYGPFLMEPTFHEIAFVPLKKTSISVFTKILEGVQRKSHDIFAA